MMSSSIDCYLVIFLISALFGLSEGNATDAATLTNRLPQTSRPRLDGRIVGGVAVDIEDVPYQASLLRSGSHMCGAAIVGWNICLTAAHCTDRSEVSELSVRVGSSILNEGGKVYGISIIIQHPNYNSVTIDSDISILILADEISFGPGINSIALAAASQPAPAGAEAVVSGWGATSEGGSSAQQLQLVAIPVVSNAVCEEIYGSGVITNTMMCAGVVEGGKDACQGDSGGPLVVDGVLMGLVSWGFGCARPNYPGVYTSIAGVRNFIKDAANI